jgi:hypothetical protein
VKKRFLIFVIVVLPSICGSGRFHPKDFQDDVVADRKGQAVIKQRSDLSKRIERFALKNGADESISVEMAELLSTLENGKVLAAIAAKESGFDVQAHGKAGEIGAYQVRPQFWGHPGDTFKSQTEKANQILEELLSTTNGNLESALEKYNGRGEKSKKYAASVLLLVSKI